MERLSAKLVRVGREDGYSADGQYAHWCPACEELHPFAVPNPNASKAKWTFDGNADRPTFSPSMNIRTGPFSDGHMEICHYFLTRGELRFRADCTHRLKGQKVPLPELPARYREPESHTMPPRTIVTAPRNPASVQPKAVATQPQEPVPARGAADDRKPDAAEIDKPGTDAPEPGADAGDLAALRAELLALGERVASFEAGAADKTAGIDSVKQQIEGLERRFIALEDAFQRRNKPTASSWPSSSALEQRVAKIEAQIRHVV